MLISFRCPPNVKERIDVLLDSGRYPDFSSFCTVALENQLLLEETHSEKATAPHGAGSSIATSSRGRGRGERRTTRKDPPPAQKAAASGTSRVALVDNERTSGDDDLAQWKAETPLADFDLAHVPEKPPFELPTAFPDMFRLGETVPLERWLFGQYNRLLPAKASLRVLAAIATDGRDGLLLETVAQRASEWATLLGEYLRSLDRRFDTHRDDLLATAFPESGSEGEKGRLRYQNQFVGHTAKGEQGGLLIGLKFAVIQVHKNKPYIFPTTTGWEFARLRNPILDRLDGVIDGPPQKLSEEEVSFVVEHIRRRVPVELAAYRVMLSLIASGKTTPESLNEALAQYLGQGRKPDDERDFVATQRSGVIGRMTDLGLVSRERQSTRITYRLTARGAKLLEDINAISVAN